MDISLYPPQKDVLESGILFSGFNCVLQMPTGSGKTWLAERVIRDTLRRELKAIYLSPLRTLATELFTKWIEAFCENSVGVFTGEYGTPGKPYPVTYEEADLLIMTPERLDSCTRYWRNYWSWIPKVDVLIVDEVHLLGDRNRGARLEGTISRLQRLNPFVRIICLSATLGNRQQLSDWLQGVEYCSQWRPIPLEWKYSYFKKATDKPSLLLREILPNLEKEGKSLVFVQSRRRAEEISKFLQENSVKAGFHHAGIGFEKRKTVETSFRQKQLDVLVATPTMEMGVNLPVRQVIIYDAQYFDGEGFKPLPVNNVWQRVGRAGRPGLDSVGEAVVLIPSWQKKSANYDKGIFEPIQSRLSNPRYLAEQVVVEVACGLARSQQQLTQIFQTSLASHQKTLPDVSQVVESMCNAKMLVVSQDEKTGKYRLNVTKLGRIVSRHLLSPTTVSLFQNVISKNPMLSYLDILLIVLSSTDCQPVLSVDFEELPFLEQQLGREKSYLLSSGVDSLADELGISNKRLLSSIKMALLLRTITRFVDPKDAAESFGCYPFEVSSLKEIVDRLLLAFTSTAEIILEHKHSQSNDVYQEATPSIAGYASALIQMIASEINEEGISLTVIQGLGPKCAQKLIAAGISDIEELSMTEVDAQMSIPGITSKRLSSWIEKAEVLSKSHSAYFYEESGSLINVSYSSWPAEVDPYRLRRSLDLDVETINSSSFRVSGGLDPHSVTILEQNIVCDCMDFKKGNLCKHTLAIRSKQDDPLILKLTKKMSQALDAPDNISLFNLWYSSPKNIKAA